MAIPGYAEDDVQEVTLERTVATVSVVAATAPDADALSLAESDTTRPTDALSDPVELVGLDAMAELEGIQITLAYDPGGLPPGASPTDVAIAVETDDGREVLESDVDLGQTEVSAVLFDRPPGSTVVAVHAETA